ncbi:MAG: LPS assembly lipoprotein LptE [Verrucomicrobiota bacterium]|nr:MAG: LPS assembly lipoprotein LptE [Verrucomicrobiota bacterium]
MNVSWFCKQCALWIAGFVLAGCQHYTRQDSCPIASIYIAPVKNSSTAPRLAESLTTALFRAFQEKTSIKVVPYSENVPDLEVEVTEFTQGTSVDDPFDEDEALAWSQKMVARWTLTDAEGNVLSDQSTFSEVDLGKQDSFQTARDQNMAYLSWRIASTIAGIVSHAW